MASLLGRAPDHVFSSLVLDNPKPDMPSSIPPRAVIEISDDDDDDDAVVCLQTLPVRPVSRHQIHTGPSSTLNIRPKPDTSPMSRRDSKRQKLDTHDNHDHTTKLLEPSGSSNKHPQLAPILFDDDDDLFLQTYPDFFDDAFMANQHDAVSQVSNETAAELLRKAALRQARRAPYYHDPKLNLLMYCGQGHENFPLPVDSNPVFQLACSAFDARQGDESDEDPHVPSGPTLLQQECLARILDVFPDIKHDFVLEKLRSRHEMIRFPDEEVEMHPDSAMIINEILEMDTYPKQKDTEEAPNDTEFEDRLGKQIMWNQDHRQNTNYHEDTIALLSNEFDRVPDDFIRKTVTEKRTLFDSYIVIEGKESNYFQQDRPYERSRNLPLHQPFKIPHDPSYHCDLVIELQAVKQHTLRKKLQSDRQQQLVEAEKDNLEQHRVNGLLVQCKCCFDEEVPMNRAVVCFAVDEHFFCYDCVRGLAESQIGMKKYEMKCMDESRCTMDLDPNGIGKAVPIKTFDRLQFNQQQAEIRAAKIEGLEQCPLCDFQAICDPIEVDSVFACQNPDCFKVTCRRCHEMSHLPKTCEEVKKDRGLTARHKIEEARTRAMIRTCPSCQSAIIKSDGCNKMRCTCGAAMCYVCKLDLGKEADAYAHFNKVGSKCPLYDNKRVDRHVQEANEAEEKAIQEARAMDETIEESTLRIETGKGKAKATHQPPKKQARRGRARAPVVDPLDFQGDANVGYGFEHDFRAQPDQLNGVDADQNRRRAFLRDARHVEWLRDVRDNYLDPLGMPAPNAGGPANPAHHMGNNAQHVPPLLAPFRRIFQDIPGFNNAANQAPGLATYNFAPLPLPSYDLVGALDNPNPDYRFLQAPQLPNAQPALYNEAYLGTAQRIHEARDEQDRRRRDRLERRNTMPVRPADIPNIVHGTHIQPQAPGVGLPPIPTAQSPARNFLAQAYANRASNNNNNNNNNTLGHVTAGQNFPGEINGVSTLQNRQLNPVAPKQGSQGTTVTLRQPNVQNHQASTTSTMQTHPMTPGWGHPTVPIMPNANEQNHAGATNDYAPNRGRRPIRRRTVDIDALGPMYGLH